MAKGKQKTDAKRAAQDSDGKKQAERGPKFENSEKLTDESANAESKKNKTLKKSGKNDPSDNQRRSKEVDQENDGQCCAEKQNKKRGRKQASKETSQISKVSSSEPTVSGNRNRKEEPGGDTKMNNNKSKPNVKEKKKGTTNERKGGMRKAATQCKQKEMSVVDTKDRRKGKLEDKPDLDEIDGDLETSEYFDSDTGRDHGENEQKRKRKYSGEKKTMSSKVKHLKTLKPDLELKKVSKVQLIQTESDDASDSDFEEVPNVIAKSPSDAHVLSKKRETVEVYSKETVSKDVASRKKVTQKSKSEKNAVEGNKSGGKTKPDLKRKHDEGMNESMDEVPQKKKNNANINSEKDDLKNKVSKRKSNSSVTEKTTVIEKNSKHSKEAGNSKQVKKTEQRKQKQKDVIAHEQNLKKSIDNSDITALLLHMEGPGAMVKPSTSYANTGDDGMMSDDDDDDDENGDDDDEEEDWEDVEDHHGYHSPVKSQLPDKPVEITLDAPVLYKKRKKKEFDIKAYFQRQINKYKRELNISMHKVHLLCLLSRGFYLNNLCMDETLEAQALSITMATRELKITSVKSCDVNGLSYMIKWMRDAFPVKAGRDNKSDDLRGRLESSFQQRSVTSRLEFVLACVILLRQLGFLTRLVMSLQPIPIRTLPKKESNSGKKRTGNPAKIQKKIKEDKADTKAVKSGKSAQKLANENTSKRTAAKQGAKTKTDNENKNVEHEKGKGGSAVKALSFEKSDKNIRSGSKQNKTERTKLTKGTTNTDLKEENSNSRLRAKNKSRRSCASKIRPNAYVDNDGATDDVDDSEEDYVPGKEEKAAAAAADDDDENAGDDGLSEEEEKTQIKKRHIKKEKVESSDSEFADESFQVRTQSLKKLTPTQKNNKALSTDSGEIIGSSLGADEWMEVFLQKEQKWVCTDCVTGKLGQPYSIEHNATPPVHYVVAFNEDGTIKDVTARYASQWLTSTRKFRGDEEWWAETVDLYRPADRQREEEEDRDIQSHLLQRPMPTSIAAFKSHPLYALKRHLLKFEAIYPDTAVPLGYVRGEPVYARECVHVLHSRENWLKEGRAVRVGEEPYKHVKSRPKWNKPKENPDALDLEVFGRWQTEVYIPPPAVDGKVPRNAHGNVELFLPSMLPAGTVHLQIEGLNKVAKKLEIDCAPAMVGWDHHCGFSHPRMDGWIVCEEFKDILLAAWDEEQEIIREKEQEKREKRVYANWKLLIKGLLIKERLKKRFDLEEEVQATGKENQSTDAAESLEKADDLKHAWPQNRQNKLHEHYNVEKL